MENEELNGSANSSTETNDGGYLNNGANQAEYISENIDEPYANLVLHDPRGSPIVEVRKDNSMLYGENSDPMNENNDRISSTNDPERADDPAKSSKNQPEVIEIRKRDSRDLLLFHLNINSIQNKFEELKSIITEDLKAQVAFITETKLDATYPSSQFKIDGFNIFRNDRKKGGGGVMAFVSSSIPSKKLGLPCAYKTIEPLVIQSRIGSHDVIFLGIYRSPKGKERDYLLKVEHELNSICSWASLQKHFLVVMGDLNLDILKPEEREGKILVDLMESQGLECLIAEPTRITPHSSTLLDVILTNKAEKFKNCNVFDPGLSDHCLVYGIMSLRAIQHRSRTIQFRSYKNTDMDDLKSDLATAPWHVGEIFDSLDERYHFWTSLLNTVLDDHAPQKKMRVRARDVPYMTTEWKNAIRAKRKYARRFHKKPTQENRELKNKWRNESTRLRRKAIKQYWKEQSNHLKSKPRQFYKTFKPFLDTKAQGTDNNKINISINGTIEQDQRKVADHFANYFATMALNIGRENVNDLKEADFIDHPSVKEIARNNQAGGLFEFNAVTTEEVSKALKNLKSHKSVGHDRIPVKILKEAAEQLTPELTNIYNECINQSYWPTDWKKGDWIPVFKKNDSLQHTNYRPITILTTVDKVYEQLISKQVTEYLEPVLSQNMTAYRKQHSCETSLIRLVEDWKLAIDRKEFVGILATDMSKAFDSLSPPLLLNKLKAYGFSENALDLLRSYFHERKNRVRMGSTTTEWKETRRGCPQGSTLGPLLWNIYQNDLTYVVKKSDLNMYADDHQLYTTRKSIPEAELTLNKEGENISKWYEENQLKGNFDKYQALIVGPSNRNKQLNVEIQGKNVETLTELVLLGVTIDEHVNFRIHIGNICKKASKQVGVLTRLRNLIPTQAKLQIFRSAILPHLTYCHTVWHFCRASDSRKLERVQERALRAVYCNRTAPYEKLLKTAGQPTLQNRRLQDIAILMYKVKNNLIPKYIQDLFCKNNSSYNLRNADFIIPRFNTVLYGKHSLKYLGPKLWSKLDAKVRSLPNLRSFRKCIRQSNITELLSEACSNCFLCSN